MRKVKETGGISDKVAVKKRGKAATNSAAPRKGRSLAPAKPKAPPPASTEPGHDEGGTERAISEAQSQVVASKFVSSETPTTKTAARPTLPPSYGESHLLLLVRDPQTLFAAWDMAPSRVQALRTQIGSRAFAVSTLTLRLTEAGGGATVFHVGKKARSRYLKVGGSPSFIAEIGFTTPAGRFELIARSAPCFVPLGPAGRQELLAPRRRSVLGYREAQALARRGVVPTSLASGKGRARSTASPAGAPSSSGPSTRGVIGGASDLYRR